MTEIWFDMLQLLGGFILAAGYFPQIRQLIKTRSARDLNFQTFLFLTIGIGCMEVYAIRLTIGGAGLMFLITNSLSLGISLLLCILIARFKRKDHRPDKRPKKNFITGMTRRDEQSSRRCYFKKGRKRMNILTDYERQFADQHHDIIYRYLRFRGLSVSEYYDVVIFRYLDAVQRYLSDPALHQYKFETIACGAMRSALCHHFEAEKRRREFCITDTSLVERLIAYEHDETADVMSKLLWLEVASHLTKSEMELVKQRADGRTYKEIASDFGIAPKTASGRMIKLRKRLQGNFNLEQILALLGN
jgi:uncharacterized protein with PQ loop repeat/DNA-directed RNA polymerase specialized sigma24 family protein